MTHHTTFHEPIHAALKAIAEILETALRDTQAATAYIVSDQQNTAIGTIIGLEDALDNAASLYKAILAMHRLQR